MDDIRPLVEALVDRHPDLEHLRGDVVARSRYVTCVLVCLFSVIGSCTTSEVQRGTFLRSTAPHAFFMCAQLPIGEIVPFAPRYIATISMAFEACASRPTDNLVSTRSIQSRSSLKVSPGVVERIGAGRSRHVASAKAGVWNFEDFTWLWNAADDAMRSSSLQYWFRALDCDDDGVLDRLDLECALDDRAGATAGFALPNHHALTRLMDIIRPAEHLTISCLDIKRSRSGPLVFGLLVTEREEPRAPLVEAVAHAQAAGAEAAAGQHL